MRISDWSSDVCSSDLVDRSLHVLVAVEMAKAAVGPGGGETGVMVDRGVEVGHGAGEIALLAPHHAHAVVRSCPPGAHGAGALEVVAGEVGAAEGAVAVGTIQVDADSSEERGAG